MSGQRHVTRAKELPESPGALEGACPTQTGPSVIAPREPGKRNLLTNPFAQRVLRWRGFQFAIQLPNVLVYLLVIVAGFYGTQTSTQNFATVMTWIIWWAAIVFTFVFVGRLRCVVRPVS